MTLGMSFDLTGIGEEWPIVPEGVYNAKVVGIKSYIKEDTGNLVWVVDLEIIQKGEWQGEKLRYYHTYMIDKPAMAKRNMVRFLKALGVLSDAQTSGDPSIKLSLEFVNGAKDADGYTEVKAVKVNDKETKVVGLRCNVVSKPRTSTGRDGKDRTFSSVDSVEPYAAATGAAPKIANKDLWNQFPK